MVIIWPSTVVLETDAVGIMVRTQCPARFPFAQSLVSIMTLLLLISCAGLSTEKLGGPQAGLHLRRISTSFGRQRSLDEFPPHFLKLLPARDLLRGYGRLSARYPSYMMRLQTLVAGLQ